MGFVKSLPSADAGSRADRALFRRRVHLAVADIRARGGGRAERECILARRACRAVSLARVSFCFKTEFRASGATAAARSVPASAACRLCLRGRPHLLALVDPVHVRGKFHAARQSRFDFRDSRAMAHLAPAAQGTVPRRPRARARRRRGAGAGKPVHRARRAARRRIRRGHRDVLCLVPARREGRARARHLHAVPDGGDQHRHRAHPVSRRARLRRGIDAADLDELAEAAGPGAGFARRGPGTDRVRARPSAGGILLGRTAAATGDGRPVRLAAACRAAQPAAAWRRRRGAGGESTSRAGARASSGSR